MADYANTRWNRRVGRNVLRNFRKNMALLAHQPWLGCLEPLLSDRAKAYRSLVILQALQGGLFRGRRSRHTRDSRCVGHTARTEKPDAKFMTASAETGDEHQYFHHRPANL